MLYEFRVEVECADADEAEEVMDWIYDLNDEDSPVIKKVTYDVKKNLPEETN